jgi:hypothetical protein
MTSYADDYTRELTLNYPDCPMAAIDIKGDSQALEMKWLDRFGKIVSVGETRVPTKVRIAGPDAYAPYGYAAKFTRQGQWIEASWVETVQVVQTLTANNWEYQSQLVVVTIKNPGQPTFQSPPHLTESCASR